MVKRICSRDIAITTLALLRKTRARRTKITLLRKTRKRWSSNKFAWLVAAKINTKTTSKITKQKPKWAVVLWKLRKRTSLWSPSMMNRTICSILCAIRCLLGLCPFHRTILWLEILKKIWVMSRITLLRGSIKFRGQIRRFTLTPLKMYLRIDNCHLVNFNSVSQKVNLGIYCTMKTKARWVLNLLRKTKI